MLKTAYNKTVRPLNWSRPRAYAANEPMVIASNATDPATKAEFRSERMKRIVAKHGLIIDPLWIARDVAGALEHLVFALERRGECPVERKQRVKRDGRDSQKEQDPVQAVAQPRSASHHCVSTPSNRT